MTIVINRTSSKEELKKTLAKVQKKKKSKYKELKKYCGILKLDEDPLVLQKKWRDEWK